MTKIDEIKAAAQPAAVKVSRVFSAPRETVFQAWSTADHIKRWFCPSGYSVPEAKVEMRVGGAFEVCMRSPEGVDHWTRGTFTEVLAPRAWRSIFMWSIPVAAGRCSAPIRL
jgi:uncharacterized protein YndB with AHSA1/START domain